MLQKQALGDLIFAFMWALKEHREWAQPGASIAIEELDPGSLIAHDDHVAREAKTFGLKEVHRRAVAAVEEWSTGVETEAEETAGSAAPASTPREEVGPEDVDSGESSGRNVGKSGGRRVEDVAEGKTGSETHRAAAAGREGRERAGE